MEYLELGDLQRHLTQPLAETEGRHIIAQVLEAVEFMHENNFVHRDLKSGVCAQRQGLLGVIHQLTYAEHHGSHKDAIMVRQDRRLWHQQAKTSR